jgi:hypothetical protein
MRDKMRFFTILLIVLAYFIALAECKKHKNKFISDDDRADITNYKCTELKESVDSNVILHVPCSMLRLMEHLKTCPLNSFFESFLSIVLQILKFY